MMISYTLLQETTKWDHDRIGYHVPNHTYIMKDSKAVGYIREGEKDPVYFKVPFNLERKGRTFNKTSKKVGLK